MSGSQNAFDMQIKLLMIGDSGKLYMIDFIFADFTERYV